MHFSKRRWQQLAGILKETDWSDDSPDPQFVIKGDYCGSDDPKNVFYHATPTKNLPEIMKQGLKPGAGQDNFGPNMSKWSGGKLFFAQGADNGRMWQEMVYDEVDEPVALIQVKLTKEEMKAIQLDQMSWEEEDPCAFYIRTSIPANRLKVVDSGESISVLQ